MYGSVLGVIYTWFGRGCQRAKMIDMDGWTLPLTTRESGRTLGPNPSSYSIGYHNNEVILLMFSFIINNNNLKFLIERMLPN